MHDTLIPLDICFVNENKTVISVHEGVPNTDDEITEDSEFVAYVIEVNSNSGIKPGDEADLEDDDEDYVMKVLAPDGTTQMHLEGGERIVSRRETLILIKKALKANASKEDKDYKALGKYMFKVLKGQDSREPEYVDAPESKNKED